MSFYFQIHIHIVPWKYTLLISHLLGKDENVETTQTPLFYTNYLQTKKLKTNA